MRDNMDFDFDIEITDRSALIAEAKHTLRGLSSELGDEPANSTKAQTDALIIAAEQLLTQLDCAVAELGAHPDVFELNEKNFAEHGLAMPLHFNDLSRNFKFYWLQIPTTLKPANNDMPFIKLKCAVEFNPGVAEGQLRPKTHTIFPDKKFKQYLELSDSLELNIGEEAEFKAMGEISEIQTGASKVSAGAGANAKVAGQMKLKIGSFEHIWKRAEVDHSTVGTEKVYWLLEGAEYFASDDPGFIVVLKVPRAVEQVNIAAALRAWPKFSLGVATPGEALRYFRETVANFFRNGAPVTSIKVWNITTNL